MSESEPKSALNLDIEQQKSFVRFFRSLPSKPASTVRLFNRSDYYTVHDDDAVLATEFAPKIIKYMGEEPKLSYLCLSRHQMETFIRELLLVRQYRIEVYNKSPGKNNDWQIEYKGSPGNLSQFEDILFENSNVDFSNSVMAVKLCKGNTIAVANTNLTDLEFKVAEIADNECFTELQALVAQIGPKECIIPGGDSPELNALKDILERSGILVAKIKRSDFSSKDVIQDLNRLLFFHNNQPRAAETCPETTLDEAMGCLQATIKFLNLTGSETNFNQYKIGKLDVNRYTRMDYAALFALNILPKSGTPKEGVFIRSVAPKTHSVAGILNNCVTAQGKRLLDQWIKQPLKDLNLINERLEIVDCFVKDSETRAVITKEALPKIPDLMILARKLAGKKARLQDCFKLYQAIDSLPALARHLRKTDNAYVKAAFVDVISDVAADMERFQSMIEELLDMDLIGRGEFMIKSSVNREMNELHECKKHVESRMRQALSETADELGLEEGKTVKLESNPQHGHFFRVTKKEEPVLRKNKNYHIIDALTGGVRFNNSRLRKLNDEYVALNERYEEEQKELVRAVLDIAIGYTDSVRSLNLILATLDVLTSFAVAAVSAKIPYVKPELRPPGTGVLKLRRVRHPCLEQQEHVNFIPNDVEFDKDGKIFHIITGPNMCGKSTYIRSVGVCVLMAQIGSFVPCEHAEISLVDAILARVGADDCQLKGLSTFMLEMIETSTILKTATEHSLVIIDELGRGTSTYDGCGIAWAIAEHLATEVKSFSLFATHFHAITKLADRCPDVGNLHVSAVTSEDAITPLYQISEGECDKSYGIHCARVADFPPDVLRWAEQHLKSLEYNEGLKYVNDVEVSVRKAAIEKGEELIRESLTSLASVAEDLDDDALSRRVEEIREELQRGDNLYVRGLLESKC
ncbi:DNA mismatch repair protein Msh2 [Cylas formicarius]|uniref:DNA mismatch repair protein Msh2 n=1 Tax=Cylas formicarius TaxID=197179 RepID=UPI002958693C|nr:DNA mismatch repair protein Msh2 [Cylas formicarius]